MARLGVWMNGEFAATWSTDRGHLLTYDPAWVRSPNARALSLSLPITALREVRGAAVAHYFEHLLPHDPGLRQRLCTRYATRSSDAFDLLTAIGRDCVGAVQLLPLGAQPSGFDRLEYVALSEREIEAHLNELTADPGADFQIALAGSQEKTALLRVHGQWARPVGATPSSHIVKLPLRGVTRYGADVSHSVENEWLCAQLVKELGLPVANTRLATFGAQRVLIVERFDRQWMEEGGPWIARLAQEDLCQAMATAPGGHREADGGPGMNQCLELLGGSESAPGDRQQFLLSQLASWLLATTDGHAKHFSIFLHPGGRYRATPLYGLLSDWPVLGAGAAANTLPYPEARLAMAVRAQSAHDRLDSIRARHWRELALKTGGPPVWQAMLKLVQRAPHALDSVGGRLDAHFPAPVWAPIEAGVRRHAARFMREAQA